MVVRDKIVARPRVHVESIVPEDFVDLFWRVFFSDKNRGVNVERHFPWIISKESKHWCVLLKSDEGLLGGLIVKPSNFTDAMRKISLGSIGLVCILPEFRGQGCAQAMLDMAIRESHQRQYDALTLWTSKHAVYRKSGFMLCDELLLGTVEMYAVDKEAAPPSVLVSAFPEGLGMPPFAVNGHLLRFKKAEVLVVQNNCFEYTLLRWSGEIPDVIAILEQSLPTCWYLNARHDNELVGKLRERGARVSLRPAALQMWKVLNPKYNLNDLKQIAKFDVVDRI